MIQMLENVKQKTISPLIKSTIASGTNGTYLRKKLFKNLYLLIF